MSLAAADRCRDCQNARVGELLLIAWRNARASLGRTVMTLVAITFGVAFLTGTLAVSDTMARNVSALFTSQYDSVDVVVRGEVVAFGIREDLDDALVDTVAAVPGVAASVGRGQRVRAAPVAGRRPDRQRGAARPRAGLDRRSRAAEHPAVRRQRPDQPSDVALDTVTAAADDVAVGQQLQVATSARSGRSRWSASPTSAAAPARR